MALVGEVARETRLGQALADLQDDYDLIVIDTPPNLGMLTVNALVPAPTSSLRLSPLRRRRCTRARRGPRHAVQAWAAPSRPGCSGAPSHRHPLGRPLTA